MKHSFKKEFRRFLCFLMTFIMILTSMPVHLLANVDHNDLSKNKSEIINNKTPVKVAKPEAGKTAADLIKNPAQPDIYTLRTDFKVQRGEKYQVDYQPYIASVGEAATQAEKDKVKKPMDLPAIAGYEKPQENFTIDYKTVKEAADDKNKKGDDNNGFRYSANKEFNYDAISNKIKIKHVFQKLDDFTKYTNPDGSVGDENALITTQQGNTGSTMEVSPLTENDLHRKGFVPEADSITMQVPENAENFILEYRYNRAHYDVVYDTQGGTALPTRTLYYEQVIPKIADAPTKVGGEFQGWKPSVDISTKDGKTFKANEIINDGSGKAIKNLAADLIMPAEKVTFTAVWKDAKKANYAVQFWAEKADHADNAGLEKYDYIGTRVYKDKDTGSRPDLDNEPIDKIVFPDLDKARLQKIWNGDKFYGDKYLYLNKFFVYNKDLTHDQNKDPKNVNLVKSVDSTGRTVYNIYYDRQVYDLYFTKSNVLPAENTFYPSIYVPDGEGGAKLAGGPGNPYHYSARFNQLMLGWPNDAMQTKGFTPGKQSYGWGPNYGYPQWPLHLDTPPYRLNADEFLDMPNYDNWGGYVSKIDKGDGAYIDVYNDPRYKDAPYKALSFGIKQDKGSMPHHMDFWMDGFKDGETIIRYDLYRFKADTNSLTYGHKYSRVQGFTPKGSTIEEGSEEHGRITEDDIDTLNEERGEITPYPDVDYTDTFGFNNALGQMHFRSAFFNNADEFGDPLDGVTPFKENGYIRFKYHRNKYPLRFNYDPSVIKDDSEFGSTNSLETFYEFPLKALNPEVDTEESYKTGNPKNILDNPEKLKELGLTDLVFNDANDKNKLKVKRPEGLSDQMVFKGWALDPAGSKLIWENPKEKMPSHPVNLYAKWDEPDYQWKVTFDPNGGALRSIDETKVTQKRKTIQVGDKGQEETKTFAQKEKNEGEKQVFTVIQRQKLKEPPKPTRKGYDFMGWEVIHYKKDANTGDYTDEIDNSYRETYKVPELYSFGNDVVSPVYLKAIWVPNDRVDVDVVHHIMSLDLSKETKKITETLHSKRTGYLVATTGDKQNEEYILANNDELKEKLPDDLKALYNEYNYRVKANNTYFQTFKVEPEKIPDPNDSSKMIDNPKAKDNVFHFFYRPFRTRDYKVNYIDERFKGKETNEGAAIIDQELVSNGNRHYDARNYRPIPGWVLVGDPQQQLFFDVNEETNEFLGINGTGKKEITFYYKDVRVIEVPKDGKTPDGYVRVTFKADKGGAFTDKDGKSVTELHYDVIKGLKSDLLPEPKELEEGKEKEAGKYYVTPETGKKFTKWDKSPLLNANTIINEGHTFTAYFEWSGLTASGLVRTEAFKDSEGKWTNDFAPTIDQLKKQLVWKEKDVVKPLPAGAKIKLFDAEGNELTTDEQVYELVNEKGKADKDQLVRTVNVKAKVTFTDGKDPQELDIPITVYKNVYEALNKAGDKPLFLKEAEGKEAKDGGLKDVTGNYVKVTVKASKDFNDKDDKIYYVNKNAWVEIPEVKTDGSSTFINWTADKDAQNENGIFDFGKRHKFTEDTVISPSDAKDVVEQTNPNKKPDVPKTYVKVIVKTTDKATDATAFEKTFWVNPTKEVAIGVTNPTGKTVAADSTKVGAAGYTMNFSKWETEDKAKTWEDKIVGKFEKETTIIAKYSVTPEKLKDQVPSSDPVHTPQGKTPTVDEITKMITPPEGKTIKEVKIVENPDVNKPGESKVKVTVEYTDGSSVGTNEKPIEVPVKVHEPVIKAKPDGSKPEGAMDNYVKVIFKAGTGGSVSGDLVYYVSPEVEVNMTESANKIEKTPDVGYISGDWDTSDTKTLKAKFTEPETVFTFEFKKTDDIVEKTDDPNQVIPEGYVKVTFKTENEAKGKLDGNVKAKIYYVNPKAEIKLVELADGQTATEKQLAVPKTAPAANYEFETWYEEIDQTNPITSERIHVAIFKLAKVTLTYKAGEGTGTAPAVVTVDHGTKVRLANADKLSKDNATFAGWKIGDKTYQAGDEVTLNENTTATAQWKSVEYKVTFDSKGGNDVPSQSVEHGKTATNPEAPKLDGKVFMGWKEKEADTKYFDFKTPIKENKTLIAIWQKPVQKIGENDTVEKQFIKVTFKEGEHGKLKLADAEQTKPVIYKVAKDLTFDQAKAAGLKVPEITPAKYYKAVDANKGWDNALDLTLAAGETEKTFTAQYEPKADVIPVDPAVTPDDKLQDDKPEGMVLVEFKVSDETSFYIPKNAKYYVKKEVEVRIPTPVVLEKTTDTVFDGWKDVNLVEETLNPADKDPKAKKFIWVKQSFKDDTVISDEKTFEIKLIITKPSAGDKRIYIEQMSDDSIGKIELIRNGNVIESAENKKFRRRRKEYNVFDFKNELQSGDLIRYWQESSTKISDYTTEHIN